MTLRDTRSGREFGYFSHVVWRLSDNMIQQPWSQQHAGTSIPINHSRTATTSQLGGVPVYLPTDRQTDGVVSVKSGATRQWRRAAIIARTGSHA